MSRYIDADAFVLYLENEIRLMEEDGANSYAVMIAGGAINDVNRQPTIDIVRCRECKHREEYPCKVYHDDDWYCADGEREGE